jgi:hypothetical protein
VAVNSLGLLDLVEIAAEGLAHKYRSEKSHNVFQGQYHWGMAVSVHSSAESFG